MGFTDELPRWTDANGFVSSKENPGPNEYGNPIQKTSEAYFLLWRRGLLDEGYKQKFFNAIRSLKSEIALWNKKPGTEDEITFDDLIWLATASAALKLKFHIVIYLTGLEQAWCLKNTKDSYFTAYAKPWHKAFYAMICKEKAEIWDYMLLIGQIFLDAFGKSPSGKKKTLGVIAGLEINSPEIENKYDLALYVLYKMAVKFWYWRLKKTFGSEQRLMISYYGEKDLLSKYWLG